MRNYVEIKLGDERILLWNNNANIDYPEDLDWGRMIHKVFEAGFEAGSRVDSVEDLTILSHDEHPDLEK